MSDTNANETQQVVDNIEDVVVEKKGETENSTIPPQAVNKVLLICCFAGFFI